MTFNQITGRFKGWVTRKLKASGEDLTYQQLIGIINKKQKSKRLEEAKRILVEDLKFDANSGTVTKLDIDEHGDVGYHDKKDKEEAQKKEMAEKETSQPKEETVEDKLKISREYLIPENRTHQPG